MNATFNDRPDYHGYSTFTDPQAPEFDDTESECSTDEPQADWKAEWDRAEKVYWEQELQWDRVDS